MSETRLEKLTDSHCREVVLGQASLEADEIQCINLNFRRVFDYENAFMVWNEIGKDIEQSCLAGTCSTRYEDVLAVDDRRPQHLGEFFGDSANMNQVFDVEVASVELADGQNHTVQAAWRDDGCHAAAVRQPRVEDRIFLRDVVSQAAGDVLDRDFQRFRAEADILNLFYVASALDKHTLGTVDHDLADFWIEDQVLDGS